MPYIKLPNGQYGKIPEGLTDEQALAFAKDKAPRAFLEPGELEERQGFGAATKQALKEFKASTESGLGALLKNETLKGWGAEDKKAAEENSFLPTTSQETSRAWKQGLLPGASSFLSQYVTEPVGGIVGRYGPVMAAQTIPYVGKGVSAALDLPAEVQENLERQKELGQKENINKALGFGLLQASLAGFGLPGTGALPNMLNKVLGKEASALGEKVLAGNITKEAALEKLHGTVYNVVKGTGVNALTGTAMMVGTEAARRASANQDITGTDAFNAYKENAIGALELSPIFGALHGIPQKGGQKRQIETAAGKRAETIRAEETAKADEQARIQAEAAQQAELQKQQIAAGTTTKDGQMEQTQYSLLGENAGETSPLPGATSTLTARERDQQNQQQQTAVDEHRDFLQRIVDPKTGEARPHIQGQLDLIQTSLDKAIENGHTEQYKALSAQHDALTKSVTLAKTQLESLPPAEKSVEQQRQNLEAKIKKDTEEFKKYTGPAYDKTKLDSIVKRLDENQKQLAALGQTDIFGLLETQDKQEAAQQKQEQTNQAIKKAEEASTGIKTAVDKEGNVVAGTSKQEAGTTEDVAAYKAHKEQTSKLQQERDRLQELYDKANSSNDIQGAIQLRDLIAKKDLEIKEANTLKPSEEMTPEKARAQALESYDPIAAKKEIDEANATAKELDDRLKKAASNKTALEKDGELTEAGKKLAEVQKQRDDALADAKRKQDILDQHTAEKGQGTLETVAQRHFTEAFPKILGTLRQHVGNAMGLRGALMGLRKQLQIARSKRNLVGKGANKDEINGIINRMRGLIENLKLEDVKDKDLPINENLSKETKEYYSKINSVRQEQRKAFDSLFNSLEALENRDYIGGSTQKAKVTKAILEKRVNDAETAFANAMLKEVVLHRETSGAPALSEKRLDTIRNQYEQAVGDIKRLARGELGAPESAKSVIAEQLSDITHAAVIEGSHGRFKGPTQKGEFNLRRQYGKPETEELTPAQEIEKLKKQREQIESYDTAPLGKATTPSAQGIDKDIARFQEKQVDVSNVGNIEQGELFSKQSQQATTKANIEALKKELEEKKGILKEENNKKLPDLKRAFAAKARIEEINKELKEAEAQKPKQLLTPLATTRATHANFMRYVNTQVQKFAKTIRETKAAIEKAKAPMKSLNERIETLRKEREALAKRYETVRDNLTEDVQDELKKQAKKIHMEGVHIADAMYGEDIKNVKIKLGKFQFEANELEKQLKSLKDEYADLEGYKGLKNTKIKINEQKQAIARSLLDVTEEYKKTQRELERLFTAFETAMESPAKMLEERLLEKTREDSIRKLWEDKLKNNREKLEQEIATKAKENEEYASKARAIEAEYNKLGELTPEQVAAEQRFLLQTGLGFPGKRISGNVPEIKQKLNELKEQLQQEKNKRGKSKDLDKIDELEQKLKAQESLLNSAEKKILTPKETEEQNILKIAEQASKDVSYSQERKEQKQRQAETRAKEGIEIAKNKKEDLQKRLNELKEKYNASKDLADRKALLVEGKKINEALKKIKATPTPESEEISQRQKGPATTKTSPPKFKLGTEKTPAQKKLEADFKEAVDSEKHGYGPNHDPYEGPSGNRYRLTDTADNKMDVAEGRKFIDKLEKKLPKDVKLTYVDEFKDLPAEEKATLARDGIIEGTDATKAVNGFVNGKGEVFIIGGNHASLKDLETTYAHELIGHVGVDRILGEKGMKLLTDRINAQDGGVYELAKKLGIDKEIQGLLHDYALTIAERTKNGASKEAIDMLMKDMEIRATRELIAHTAEQRVSEAFTQKANRWMKELVGAVRSWLRNNGFAELSKVSTSDIYHIIKQSEKSFRKNELGGYRTTDGGVAFSKKPLYNPNFDTAKQELASKFIGREKSVLDRIKASSIGMTLAHRFEDRFAGLNYIARTMADRMAGMQMMYFNRLYDQRNNMMAEIATHGPVGIVKNADGSFTYKSKEVDSLKTVLEHIKKAAPDIGNAQAAMEQFGLYLAAERAAVVGKEKLSFLENLKEEDLEKLRKDGRANSHFQAARKAYKTYNDGQIDFMVESGRLSKAEGKALKDKGDYVAFYREKNGQIIDEENQITVGNLKNQQYLKELIGGDKPIVSFEEGALQNTYMLTDMAMSNIATKNTAYTLRNLGIAEIKKGDKTGDNIVRFYENGEKMYAELNTNKGYEGIEKRLDKMRAEGKAGTEDFKRLRARAEMGRESSNMFGSIPPELIVKGMEGVSMTLPTAISFMRGPANLLRKAVTRNPAYSARVAFKDSISSWITTGSDVTPVLSALGSIKELMGKETPAGIRSLQEQGIVGGHVFSGTMSDMRDLARKVAGDEKGWEKLWAKADRLAIMADESSRLSLYNGFIKKGLSPMEASLATLESQNFTKHGYSPSIRALSVMIPFFNAQIQGMSTFIRNGLGKSLFEDKLNVKNNLMRRGAMLAGLTLAYTALSQNTEAYKNATEDDKLNYWFIPIPGFKEPIRSPIPFEAGTVFKALPQAVFELAATDAKSKDVLPAIRRQILSNVPGMSSMFVGQAFKPALEAATNTDFYSLKPIESTAQLSKKAGYRSYAETTEVSKMLGQNLGISPIQIDHMIKGYTSSTGIALMSMFNPLFASTSSPENKTSQLPIIGQFFQPTDGSGLINKAYDDMTELMKINRTYKELEDTNEKEADRYAEKYAKELDLASAAGAFQRGMGEYNKYEKEVRADNTLTPAQKRKELDAIKKEKIEYAKDFSSSRE